MRSKEEANDYRYFPDPDLLPVEIEQSYIDAVRETLPELPDQKTTRFVTDYKIKSDDADILTNSIALADYFEAVAGRTQARPQVAANWVIGDLSAALNRDGLSIDASMVSADALAGLIDRIHDNTISGKIAKEVFEGMWSGEGSADDIIEARGLKQITDSGAIDAIVDQVIAAKPVASSRVPGRQGETTRLLCRTSHERNERQSQSRTGKRRDQTSATGLVSDVLQSNTDVVVPFHVRSVAGARCVDPVAAFVGTYATWAFVQSDCGQHSRTSGGGKPG